MEYLENHEKLKEAFSSVKSKMEFDDYEIYKFKFDSFSNNILPGNQFYHCEKHQLDFKNDTSFYNDVGTIQDEVHIKDIFVEENRKFDYYVLKPKNSAPVKKVTFMLHGFNEKNWEKYLTWGQAICERSESAIVFFPIAFHMQRAPLQWSEKRKMFELSEKRKKKFPNIIHSTLSNVAISMRLHSMPQRFIWSGLQTYYDIIQFIEDIKNDKHTLIDKNFTFNIFAYSIGGLLAEILKLSNYKNYFDETKVCLFCSGAVFNRLSPVSKFILDSEANVALYSYLVEHFDSFLKKDAMLHHYIGEDHLEGKVFHSMLEYQKMRDFRESLFKKAAKKIYAISLKQDSVIPSFEIINTLKGAFRDIDIVVDEFDFNYKYTHENPFPINCPDSELINENFSMVFDKIGSFLND
ncbi:MAG: hypothetical protein CVV23_04285 [Ignavibacteriae bacterium HGW-Ignavibacteriae-2]|jgi:hypothetical protein|nr:MAG: hypothetical protein CVV23_04285 [Ignavibacteriae bacterium HGW-Ignavibacteriae-2]